MQSDTMHRQGAAKHSTGLVQRFFAALWQVKAKYGQGYGVDSGVQLWQSGDEHRAATLRRGRVRQGNGNAKGCSAGAAQPMTRHGKAKAMRSRSRQRIGKDSRGDVQAKRHDVQAVQVGAKVVRNWTAQWFCTARQRRVGLGSGTAQQHTAAVQFRTARQWRCRARRGPAQARQSRTSHRKGVAALGNETQRHDTVTLGTGMARLSPAAQRQCFPKHSIAMAM